MKAASHSPALSGSMPEFFSHQVSAARRFYLDLNPPRERPLTIVSGGFERCAADYSIHRSTFPFFSIEYVTRGQGTVKLQGRPQVLQPGRLFSYGPGVEHEIVTEAATPLEKYFVDFAGTQARALLRSCGLAPGTALQIFPPSGVQGLFEELIAGGQRSTRHSRELCVKLLECLTMKIADSQAPLAGRESLSFTTYQHCREHIQQHFLRLKTLDQVTRECHVDGAYLCRLFRRYDHQSPYQYLLRLKMNQAAEWLQTPGTLVKQVSEQLGFTDPCHFSRAFKAAFGLAPETFRRWR